MSRFERVRAVKNSKKEISILAALQSGAKERADKRKKARIRGQIRGLNMESLRGVPLILAALQSGAKEHAEERNKRLHSGPHLEQK
jgi:hypothetical protein